MAQVINTNVNALFAGNALNKSAKGLLVAQERLSSGLRINSAKDDSIGMMTASKYDTEIRGTNIAIRNANDSIAKAQTNDGYGAQIQENLQRLNEIAVQSGGSVDPTKQAEVKALIGENARIAGLTTAATPTTVDGLGTTVTGVSAQIAAPTGVSVADIAKDIANVTADRANYGADAVRFGSAVSTMQITSVNLSSSFSRVMDTDYAAETASQSRNNILQQAGTAILAQANQNSQSVLQLLR